MKRLELKQLKKIFTIPFSFVLIMWIIKIVEVSFGLNFSDHGVLPQTFSGLQGILLSPFIHSDFTHLSHNSYPIIILGGMLYFFYKKIANTIFLWLFFVSGFWLWVFGGFFSGYAYHIGASGLIYALASFIFFSGIIRKNPKLAATSLVVIFLYGGLFWGLLYLKPGISWEGHLCGFFAGLLLAFYYKNEGPKRKKYQWEIEEEMEEILNKQELLN